jgi:hypothetical protein
MKSSFVNVLSILLLGTLSLFSNPSFAQRKSSSDVYVRPYVKSNGTVVQGHMRSAPDKTAGNNFSTKGNVNPYTGAAGTVVVPGAGMLPAKPATLQSGFSIQNNSVVSQFESLMTSLIDRLNSIESIVNNVSQRPVSNYEGRLANIDDRLSSLNTKLDELAKKLNGIELVLSSGNSVLSGMPINTETQSPKTTVAGASLQSTGVTELKNSLRAWRLLRKGMTYDQVRNTLGEPDKIRVSGSFAYWTYGNTSIDFYQEMLTDWTEPTGLKP